MKRLFFLLAIITVLLLTVIAFSLTTTSIANAAPPLGVQKWEFAVMVYVTKTANATAATLDDDERTEINDFFQTLKDTTDTDKIPAIYYANVLGGYGFELVSHENISGGEVFYFKRPT